MNIESISSKVNQILLFRLSQNKKKDENREESLVIPQSTMYEEFVQRLMSSCKRKFDDISKENVVVFSERHLKNSLSKLAQEIMTRSVYLCLFFKMYFFCSIQKFYSLGLSVISVSF